MHFTTKILLIIGSAIVLLCCNKEDSFDNIPVLEFEEFTIFKNIENVADSALFKFIFEDGDGNLGSLDSDELNCFLMYEEKNGNSSVNFPEIPRREFNLSNFTADTRKKKIEGSILLVIKPAPIYNVFTDSAFRYSCYVVDRDGNYSNIIFSNWNLKN